MNDIGESLQRCPELDREHELADVLACARSDEGRADEHSARSVGDQLERATVKVVDVAARGLSRIGAGDDDVDAFGPRGSFRSPTDATSGSVNVTRGTAV